MSRPAPTASGIPSSRPIATRLNAPRKTNCSTFRAVRAQRHANSDFVGALRHGIRGHAIKPDRRQNQRHDAEESGEAGDGALLIEREFDLLLHGSDAD